MISKSVGDMKMGALGMIESSYLPHGGNIVNSNLTEGARGRVNDYYTIAMDARKNIHNAIYSDIKGILY